MQARAHRFDQPLLLVQAHQADPESQRGGAVIRSDHILGEVGRDRRQQGAHSCLRELRRCGLRRRRYSGCLPGEQIRQREGGAQARAPAAVTGAVAEAREHGPLVGAHPFDRGQACHVRAADHEVDLAPDAGRALERR